MKPDPQSGMSSDKVREIKVTMAGLAADAKLAVDGVDVGSISAFCIQRARVIAGELVALGVGPGNVMCFVPQLDAGAVDRAVSGWLSWAYGKACDMMTPVMLDEVKGIADQLVESGVLYPDDIRKRFDALESLAA